MSTAQKIAECLGDGTITCDLSSEFSDTKLIRSPGASPTRIVLAEFIKCGIPVAIKIFLDLTKLPKDGKLKYAEELDSVYGLKYEVKVYTKIVNVILNKHFSPNFVRAIGYNKCSIKNVDLMVSGINNFKDIYGNLLRDYPNTPVSVLVTERAGGPGARIQTLKEFSMSGEAKSEMGQVMFQIIYSLVVMQKFRLVHNDMHAGNILVAKLPNKVRRLYVVNGKKFLIYTRYVPYLFDWDFAYTDKLGKNKKVEGICESLNICNRYSEKSDLYMLLCTLEWGGLGKTYSHEVSHRKEGEMSITITADENRRLQKYYAYLPEEKLYKMGSAQLNEVFGNNVTKYFGKNVTSVMFRHKNREIVMFSGFRCRPTSYSADMPTPMELLLTKFTELETKTAEGVEATEIYMIPGSTQTKASIYRDPFVRSTRSQIQGYPAIEPKKLNSKNLVSIAKIDKQQQTSGIPGKWRKSDSSPKHRAKVVSWVFLVCHKFEFSQRTLVLAVNILDQYMSKVTVPNTKLQLVAASALKVAHIKTEKMFAMDSDFVYMAGKAFTEPELVDMSAKVSKSVDENVNTSYDFLMKYVKFVNDMSKEQLFLARYLLDLSLLKMLFCSPSVIAAAVLKITRKYYNLLWTDRLTGYVGSNARSINSCAKSLFKLTSSKSTAVKDIQSLYSSDKYGGVATLA